MRKRLFAADWLVVETALTLWFIAGYGVLCSRAAEPTQRSPRLSALSYKRYNNEKYGYSVLYPAFLRAGQEPDAGDGLAFTAPGVTLRMKVWAAYSNWLSGDEMTIDQELDFAVKNLAGDPGPKLKVLRQGHGKNWFSVLSTTGREIIFERTAKKGGKFITVQFVYPASKPHRFDPIIVKVAESLRG